MGQLESMKIVALPTSGWRSYYQLSAMKIVGHKSDKMWKRYNAIDERDLTQAAQKVHKYLQENTPETLDYFSRK